ncbi:MAG: DUF192 domain-containing protein [Burkholderiaceae bacterium]|nr:DUF192 domain-containing protein [Burkholderiaceae bacterium]
MTFAFRSFRAALVCAAAAWLALAAHAQPQAQPAPQGQPQMDLPRTQLTAGMYRLNVQVARAQQELETGLMFRRQMPAYEGMLFVFDRPGVQCFWMKNTLLPLTAAFIADDGAIVNLADMAPMTVDNHCSTAPVRYVLEVNQGWFAQRHIRAGAKLGGDVFSKISDNKIE